MKLGVLPTASFTLAFFLFGNISALAQNPSQVPGGSTIQTTTQPLSLPQSIDIAYHNSPRLRQADLGLQQSDLLRQGILIGKKPRLRYRAGLSYAPIIPPYFGYDPALSNEGQVNAQILLDQSIYDGGARNIQLQQAQLDLTRLRKDQELARANLRLDVIRAYADVVRAQDLATVQRQSLQELRDYHSVVERLYAGGTAGYTDVLKTDIQIALQQTQYSRTLDDALIARYTLSETMGISPDSVFTVGLSLDSLVSLFRMQSYLADSTLRLQIEQQNIAIQNANLDVELARAAKKPVISLVADAGILSSIQNLTLPKDQRSSIVGASAGVSIEGPILDWGANDLVIQQKELQAQIEQENLNILDRTLRAQMLRSRTAIVRLSTKLDSAATAIQLAIKNYDLIKAKYAGGGASALEVLDAQKQVLDARLNRLQILSDIQSFQTMIYQPLRGK